MAHKITPSTKFVNVYNTVQRQRERRERETVYLNLMKYDHRCCLLTLSHYNITSVLLIHIIILLCTI